MPCRGGGGGGGGGDICLSAQHSQNGLVTLSQTKLISINVASVLFNVTETFLVTSAGFGRGANGQ